MKDNYATLDSQIGNGICNVEDTEEIFWLRMSDDYQSKVRSGDLLVGQYRFKDAVTEYRKALGIKSDEALLYIKIAGAYLTLLDYHNAQDYYDNAVLHGAAEGVIAFYLGIKSFLQGRYGDAISHFEKANTDSGEMLISVIYWHTIASYRAGTEPRFLNKYHKDMDVGHHVAYKTAVSVFSGEVDDDVPIPPGSLDSVIVLYGISEYLRHENDFDRADICRNKALEHTDVWPCIAYLAAYNNRH